MQNVPVPHKKKPIILLTAFDQLNYITYKKKLKDLGGNYDWKSVTELLYSQYNTKLLQLLRRTCPLLTCVRARCTLYLSHITSQLYYASDVWSPHIHAQKITLEQVQRRATRWISPQCVWYIG